jgi:hypothetical protein
MRKTFRTSPVSSSRSAITRRKCPICLACPRRTAVCGPSTRRARIRSRLRGAPPLSTNADGKPICVYHIEYDINDNCQIGRPLVHDSFVVVAPPHATSA